MNFSSKVIIGIIGTILLFFLLYKLMFIVILILLAGFISLMLNPLMEKILLIKFRKIAVPNFLASLITLFIFLFFIFSIFYLIYPLVINQWNDIASINFKELSVKMEAPIIEFQKKFKILEHFSLIENLKIDELFTNIYEIVSFKTVLSNATTFFSKLAFSILSVSFMVFFFLKEKGLFLNMILAVVPDKYETKTQETVFQIKSTISKYLLGILIQFLIILTLYSSSLYIANIPNSWVLALFGAVLNIVPFLGIILTHISSFLIIFIFGAGHEYSTDMILNQVILSSTIIGIIQLIDAFISQPTIFSKSVKAHPLEIFLIVISSGTLFGFVGMLLAIPLYSVFRIIAKMFLRDYKIIGKITKNI